MQAADISLTQAKKWNKIAWIVIAVCAVLVLLWCIFAFGIAIIDSL